MFYLDYHHKESLSDNILITIASALMKNANKFRSSDPFFQHFNTPSSTLYNFQIQHIYKTLTAAPGQNFPSLIQQHYWLSFLILFLVLLGNTKAAKTKDIRACSHALAGSATHFASSVFSYSSMDLKSSEKFPLPKPPHPPF